MRSFIHACLFTGAAVVLLIPAIAFAQTANDARQVPAPWRPSFGALGNAAANAAAHPSANPSAPPTQNPRGINLQTDALRSPVNSPNTAPNSVVQPTLGQSTPAGTGPAAANQQLTTQNTSSSAPQFDQAPRVARNEITRISKTMNMLPNDDGQIWREYDISPYTANITANENPQQAILDWILRETGTDMWFNQPMGILNADRDHIYVYHTPEIHNVVRTIVDRFVHTRGQLQIIDINLVTVDKPNWRSNVYRMLQPVEVQSPGVEAWLVSKENAAILLSQISRRSDFQQHSSGRLTAHDGQNLVLRKTQPRQFVRNLRWVSNQYPNYQPLMTTVDEGYQLSISSLSSLDNSIIEATIKCNVDQVEKLNTVKVDVPGSIAGSSEQMNLQIPQLISWRLHERFRWPNDQVLLLSCGVVAKPEAQFQVPGNLPRVFNTNRNRADALLFIEYRGPAVGGQLPNPILPAAASAQLRSLSQLGERTSLEPEGLRQANLTVDTTDAGGTVIR